MFKLVLEKTEEPEIKLPTSAGSWKKQESSRKTSTSALLTIPKPLPVWITINCGKFFKSWEYQTTLPASWEICMQVKKQQLELDMEQQTGSTLGKEYVKVVYCHPAYLTDMQGDNIQPWHTPFPIWNQSVVPRAVLTVASWPAYRFPKRQVRWSGIPISFRIFHTLLWSTQSKALA